MQLTLWILVVLSVALCSVQAKPGGKGKGKGRGESEETSDGDTGGSGEGSKGKAPLNRPLTENDWNNGKKLKDKPGKGKEGGPGKFELDIALGPEDLKLLNKTGGPEANGLSNTRYRWPDARVPYYISRSFSDYDRSRIAHAIDVYHQKTCIKFVPASGQADYLYFTRDDGCWSYVGRIGGRQELSIGSGCSYTGIVQHEIMHALGFFHEQGRPDRDSYVSIKWENIRSGMEGNFRKHGYDRVTTFGTPYDYQSVMHYGKTYFSKNGQPTIVAFNGADIGQRSGLSANDVKKLNLMYSCDSTGPGPCVDKYPSECRHFAKYCPSVKDICCATCG